MMILALAAALAVPSTAVEFRSGPARTRLVELYGSEGCSSCPPADAWLAPLKAHPRLWKDFVPVAFQVDYWDYLGWKDRYASPAFSARQRAYAAAWGVRSVYTPEFVLDGTEWRGWGGEPPRAEPGAGRLEATWTTGVLKARFVPASDAGPYDLYAAPLGMDLDSAVSAGENSGRVLHHEFVARSVARTPMTKRDAVWTARLAAPSEGARALALWVVGRDGRPVQAAGGPLP